MLSEMGITKVYNLLSNYKQSGMTISLSRYYRKQKIQLTPYEFRMILTYDKIVSQHIMQSDDSKCYLPLSVIYDNPPEEIRIDKWAETLPESDVCLSPGKEVLSCTVHSTREVFLEVFRIVKECSTAVTSFVERLPKDDPDKVLYERDKDINPLENKISSEQIKNSSPAIPLDQEKKIFQVKLRGMDSKGFFEDDYQGNRRYTSIHKTPIERPPVRQKK